MKTLGGTITNSSSPRGHPASDQRGPGPPNVGRVEVSGLLLVVLIAAYFALLIFTARWLTHTAWLVRGWSPPAEEISLLTAVVVRTALYSSLLLLFVRVVWSLWQVLYGLVTAKHDDATRQNLEGVPLPPDEGAPVHELAKEVGLQVGAPPPDAIYISEHPDCYAVELRRFGLRTRRRLILVLGLPQLEVLTVEELKSILAHELAHFRGDTRLALFAFRFFESLRTSTDALRDRWWRWIDPIYWFSKAYIQLFFFCSNPLRRRQELHADCWSAAVYGGRLAARTLLKDLQVGAQFESTLTSFKADPQATPHERPGNVFRWFRVSWRELTPNGYDYLRRRLEAEEQASFWDSHPTIKERLEVMRRYHDREDFPADEPSRGSDMRPAHQLLPNLTALEDRLHQRVFPAHS